MNSRFAIVALSTALTFGAAAAPARADVMLTPYIGGLFSGDLPTQKVAYGVALTAMGKGIIGGEVDFSFAPKFVDETALTTAVREMNLMGNIIVGIPIGGQKGASIRPYVAGGVGLIRATADESDFVDKLSTNDFAYNLGGGVFGTVNDHFGLRADLRYFRTTSDTNRYRFWRGLGGVVLRF